MIEQLKLMLWKNSTLVIYCIVGLVAWSIMFIVIEKVYEFDRDARIVEAEYGWKKVQAAYPQYKPATEIEDE